MSSRIVYTFIASGTLPNSDTEVDGYRVALRNLTIVKVIASLVSTGSAGSSIIDINLNGTTIFTTQANRPTVLYNDADKYDEKIPDVTSISAGDKLSMDIDQRATNAQDLTVEVICKPRRV